MAVNILNNGSMKFDLQCLSLQIWLLADTLGLSLYSRWVPRKLNKYADMLSRVSDTNDSSVNPAVFKFFDKLWGPYSFDRFADENNKKCDLFNSISNCPFNSGIDAFNFDWHGFNNWLVPPVHLISKTILHAIKCKALCTLVIPKWPSASFWPLLMEGHDFKSFIKGKVEYIKPKAFFLPGRNKLFSKPLKFDILVIKIDFS